MEAGKSTICRVGWQAGEPAEWTFQFKSESCLLENSSRSGEGQPLGLFRPSTD